MIRADASNFCRDDQRNGWHFFEKTIGCNLVWVSCFFYVVKLSLWLEDLHAKGYALAFKLDVISVFLCPATIWLLVSFFIYSHNTGRECAMGGLGIPPSVDFDETMSPGRMHLEKGKRELNAA